MDKSVQQERIRAHSQSREEALLQTPGFHLPSDFNTPSTVARSHGRPDINTDISYTSDASSHRAPPASKDTKSGRYASLDTLRGLIMLVMAWDHTRDYAADKRDPLPKDSGFEIWSGPFATYDDNLGLFLQRWVTDFCAPGFFFLMGLGMVLFADARERRGWSSARISRFFLLRGILLVVFDRFVNMADFSQLVHPDSWSPRGSNSTGGGGNNLFPTVDPYVKPLLGVFEVLTALGMAMIVCGVLLLPLVRCCNNTNRGRGSSSNNPTRSGGGGGCCCCCSDAAAADGQDDNDGYEPAAMGMGGGYSGRGGAAGAFGDFPEARGDGSPSGRYASPRASFHHAFSGSPGGNGQSSFDFNQLAMAQADSAGGDGDRCCGGGRSSRAGGCCSCVPCCNRASDWYLWVFSFSFTQFWLLFLAIGVFAASNAVIIYNQHGNPDAFIPFPRFGGTATTPWEIIQRFFLLPGLYTYGVIVYPLIPWLGLAITGMCIGLQFIHSSGSSSGSSGRGRGHKSKQQQHDIAFLTSAGSGLSSGLPGGGGGLGSPFSPSSSPSSSSSSQFTEEKLRNGSFLGGLLCWGLFLIIRFFGGDVGNNRELPSSPSTSTESLGHAIIRVLAVCKYPPSVAYALVTTGGNLMAIAIFTHIAVWSVSPAAAAAKTAASSSSAAAAGGEQQQGEYEGMGKGGAGAGAAASSGAYSLLGGYGYGGAAGGSRASVSYILAEDGLEQQQQQQRQVQEAAEAEAAEKARMRCCCCCDKRGFACQIPRIITEVLMVYGRTPLFFYVLHFWMLGGIAAILHVWTPGLFLGYVPLIWFGLVLVLFFACRAYGTFKNSTPQESLWRFL